MVSQNYPQQRKKNKKEQMMKKIKIIIISIFAFAMQTNTAQAQLNYQTYNLNASTLTSNEWPNLDLQPITETGTLQTLNEVSSFTENAVKISGYIKIEQQKTYKINTDANGKTLIWIDEDPIINQEKHLATGWHQIAIDYLPTNNPNLNITIDNQPIQNYQTKESTSGYYCETFKDARVKATTGTRVASLPDFNSLPSTAENRTASIQDEIIIGTTSDSATRCIGYLPIHQGGDYTFSITSENKAQVFVNDKVIADITQITFTKTIATGQGTINLQPGIHKIELQTYTPLNTQPQLVIRTYKGPDTQNQHQSLPTQKMKPTVPAAHITCDDQSYAIMSLNIPQTCANAQNVILQTNIYIPEAGNTALTTNTGQITIEELQPTTTALNPERLSQGWYKMTINEIDPKQKLNLQLTINSEPAGYQTNALPPEVKVNYIKSLNNEDLTNINCDQIYANDIPLQNYVHKTHVLTNIENYRWREQTNYKLCYKARIIPLPEDALISIPPETKAKLTDTQQNTIQVMPQEQPQKIEPPINQKQKIEIEHNAIRSNVGIGITYEVAGEEKGRIPEILNRPPQIIKTNYETDEELPLTININEIATDPDGDTITIERATAKGTGRVINNGTTLEYIPAEQFHGQETIDITITDNDQTTNGTLTITVHSTNDAPEFLQNNYHFTIKDTDIIVGYVTATDPDDSDANLTYTMQSNTFTIDSNTGYITVKPTATLTQLTYQHTVKVTDTGKDSDTAQVTINVDYKPRFDQTYHYEKNLKEIFFSKDANDNFKPLTLTPNVKATDRNGDQLTYRITQGNELNLFAINSTTGQITITKIPENAAYIDWNFELTIRAEQTNDASQFAETTAIIAIDPFDDSWCRALNPSQGKVCWTYFQGPNPHEENGSQRGNFDFKDLLTTQNDAFDFPALQNWTTNKHNNRIPYIPSTTKGTCTISSATWAIGGFRDKKIGCHQDLQDEMLMTYIGYFDISQEGTYILSAVLDDAAEVFIDNKKIMRLGLGTGTSKISDQEDISKYINLDSYNSQDHNNKEVYLTAGTHRIIIIVFEVESGWKVDEVNLTQKSTGTQIGINSILTSP